MMNPERLDHAVSTATKYMIEAKNKIDEVFGEGHAEQHPELVGQFMRVCVDMEIADVIDSLSQNVDVVGDAMAAQKSEE